MKGKWLLLDGYNLAFRAFYGMPELTRKDGFPTGALHGWVRTLWRLLDDQQPNHLVVFFDLDGASKREALQEDYKANRSEMPEPLAQQMPVIRELTAALGYRIVQQSGVEADDLIGYAAHRLADAGASAVIVSADKDLAQCVRDGVIQLLPPPTANPRLGWRSLDAVGVREKFAVSPAQIPDYLALIGDTSDNIPGLQGVGPKTAAKWLGQYGTLEKIIQNSGMLKPPRFQAIVHKSAERLRQNLVMTTLEEVEAPDAFEPLPADFPAALAILTDLEMDKTAVEARRRYGL